MDFRTEGWRHRCRLSGVCAAAAAAFLLAACTVHEATPDRFTIEVNSYYANVAMTQAQDHCARFGRRPVLVRSEPAPPSWSMLFTRATISTFDCVAPGGPDEAAASAPADAASEPQPAK